jgi:gliding motility-associated lipoprotein GldB
MMNKTRIYRLIIFATVTLTVLSCNRNRLKVDISDIEEEISIVRFENVLFELPLNDTLAELSALRDRHPDFFDLFTRKVINIGGIEEESFPLIMGKFFADTMIQNVKRITEQKFSDFKTIEKDLTEAFKYYRYHFPEMELPVIYTMISGFNQSVVTAENIIGVSLDKYLGRDCIYYQNLQNIPFYKMKNMHPDKIVSDVAYAWGFTEFNETINTTTLLDNIIYQGKLMYFVDALLPEVHDSLKIGYTSEQLEWCISNEPQMWNFIIENKKLFSNDRMDILRFINDAPYTTGFPVESPPRTGIWIGWQIVRQYMKKHKEITLSDLMRNTDYQQILNDSGYYPE